MNQDELRDRQRRRVKHRYHETIRGLSRSRELVQQLTEQHCALLEQQVAVLPQGNDAAMRSGLRRYTEAVGLADQLRQEKQILQALIDEREKQQHRLATLVDEYQRDHVSGFMHC